MEEEVQRLRRRRSEMWTSFPPQCRSSSLPPLHPPRSTSLSGTDSAAHRRSPHAVDFARDRDGNDKRSLTDQEEFMAVHSAPSVTLFLVSIGVRRVIIGSLL